MDIYEDCEMSSERLWGIKRSCEMSGLVNGNMMPQEKV